MKITSNIEAERFVRMTQPGDEHYFRLSRSPSYLEYLQLLIREAATWCSMRPRGATAESSLRGDTIRPSVLPRSRWDCVGDVAYKRRGALQREHATPTTAHAGRLLLYYPDLNLVDGAAQAASKGFFDEDNAPPFETWIAYFEDAQADASYRSYLLSWVPEDLLPLADVGIRVNPEECLVWATASDQPIREALAMAGMLC